MSYVKVWVHAVWGTKNREPVLSKDTQKDLFYHIKDNAKEKEIYSERLYQEPGRASQERYVYGRV